MEQILNISSIRFSIKNIEDVRDDVLSYSFKVILPDRIL